MTRKWCNWDSTQWFLSIAYGLDHSAILPSVCYLKEKGPWPHKHLFFRPLPRVGCSGLLYVTPPHLIFTVRSHETAEWIQNHPENTGRQPAVSPLLSLWELPGRNDLGGEPGGHQADRGRSRGKGKTTLAA